MGVPFKDGRGLCDGPPAVQQRRIGVRPGEAARQAEGRLAPPPVPGPGQGESGEEAAAVVHEKNGAC